MSFEDVDFHFGWPKPPPCKLFEPCGMTPTATPTPTPTLEPGEVRITDGPTTYDGVEDGRCYVEIPACTVCFDGSCWTGACSVEWGREVSCDDWKTAVPVPLSLLGTVEEAITSIQYTGPPWPTPTPTPEPNKHTLLGFTYGNINEYFASEDGKCYRTAACSYWEDGCIWTGACPVEWGKEVSCDDWETTVPTPTPEASRVEIILSPSGPDLSLSDPDLSGRLDTGRRYCPPCRCPSGHKRDMDGSAGIDESADADGSMQERGGE